MDRDKGYRRKSVKDRERKKREGLWVVKCKGSYIRNEARPPS